MAVKTISMSVRVSEEDAQFLATLEMPGATTPSDKLRAIIDDARQRRLGAQDFQACLGMLERLTAPARRQVRAVEHEKDLGSELVDTAFEWLPHSLAWMITSCGDDAPANQDVARLRQFENGLAGRVFALLERILRLGVTKRCRCYDPGAIRTRLAPILEIARLIESQDINTKEPSS